MILTGMCSWAESTLIESGQFYPPECRTPEARLRHYASVFPTVEVDSTYYAIPRIETALMWARRTPEDFVFHVKVYGALTGHAVRAGTLPEGMRGEGDSLYIKDEGMRRELCGRMLHSLSPLKEAGKLGVLLYQYPPWFRYGRDSLARIEADAMMAKGQKVAVEFRHGSWLEPARREGVFKFLSARGLVYVTADEPQYGSLATVPFVPEATSDVAYVRLHGRNAANWLRRGIAVSLRYDYQYSEEELSQMVPHMRRLGEKTSKAYVMFNNCHGASAALNAKMMREMLEAGA